MLNKSEKNESDLKKLIPWITNMALANPLVDILQGRQSIAISALGETSIVPLSGHSWGRV